MHLRPEVSGISHCAGFIAGLRGRRCLRTYDSHMEGRRRLRENLRERFAGKQGSSW
jgi:hypothetical protein